MMVSAGFLFGKSGTELVGISSSVFIPIRKLSNESNKEILANEYDHDVSNYGRHNTVYQPEVT